MPHIFHPQNGWNVNRLFSLVFVDDRTFYDEYCRKYNTFRRNAQFFWEIHEGEVPNINNLRNFAATIFIHHSITHH